MNFLYLETGQSGKGIPMIDYDEYKKTEDMGFSLTGIKELQGQKNWEVFRDYINARYEDFLANDRQKVNEVIRAIRYRWFITASKCIYNCMPEEAVDITDDITIYVLEQRVFNFSGRIADSNGFYQYLMGLLQYAIKRKYGSRRSSEEIYDSEMFQELSGEEEFVSEEETDQDLNAFLDLKTAGSKKEDSEETEDDAKEKTNKKKRVFHIEETHFEQEDAFQDPKPGPLDQVLDEEEQGELNHRCYAFLSTILDSQILPFQTISCCYAVLLPIILKFQMEQCPELHIGIDPALKYVWENFYDRDYTGSNKKGFMEYRYADAFIPEYKNCISTNIKNLKLPYPIEKNCYSTVVIPVLSEMVKQQITNQKIPREYLRFVRRLIKELEQINPDEINILRKSMINSVVAEYFMEEDTIYTMSEKFISLLNSGLFQKKDFAWGTYYQNALSSEYKSYNYDIECMGEVVFKKQFSSTQKDSTASSNSTLISNINQFAKRGLAVFLKQSVDRLSANEQIDCIQNNTFIQKSLKGWAEQKLQALKREGKL